MPVLDYQTVARVRRDFEPVPGNYLRSAEALMLTIDHTLSRPNTSRLQMGLGELTMYAIEQQLQFINQDNPIELFGIDEVNTRTSGLGGSL